MKEATGKCKTCLGCMRLEQESFTGTDKCKYAPDWIKECKKILEGEQTYVGR